jgi:hypothetical protein
MGSNKRIQNTFKSFEGVLFDPETMVLNFYDPLGALIATKSKADCNQVPPPPGVWYIDYAVPDIGPIGRWTLEWKETTGGFTSSASFGFCVFSINEPTELEVRVAMGKVAAERLDPESIEMSIYEAMQLVDAEKSEVVNLQTRHNAILAQSAYSAYLKYVGEFERSTGEVPPPLLLQLGRLEENARTYLQYARRGTVATAPVVQKQQTLQQEYENGSYE